MMHSGTVYLSVRLFFHLSDPYLPLNHERKVVESSNLVTSSHDNVTGWIKLCQEVKGQGHDSRNQHVLIGFYVLPGLTTEG